MPWIWPLKGSEPLWPDAPGRFGAVRQHDVHTGVDLYCELGQEVVAVEAGEVIRIEAFTGPNADDPSPWWNDTQAILVRGESGVVTYGEVKSLVSLGDRVEAGQVIAVVETPVLRSFKGRPMVMLHFEWMIPEAKGTTWWKTDDDGNPLPRPPTLFDPSRKLLDAADGVIAMFDLATYDGKRFRDPLATPKPSKWWAIWGGSCPDEGSNAEAGAS